MMRAILGSTVAMLSALNPLGLSRAHVERPAPRAISRRRKFFSSAGTRDRMDGCGPKPRFNLFYQHPKRAVDFKAHRKAYFGAMRVKRKERWAEVMAGVA